MPAGSSLYPCHFDGPCHQPVAEALAYLLRAPEFFRRLHTEDLRPYERAMTFTLAKPWNDRRRHYDVIVVGSGYGGGVAASSLARAGKTIAVLERGREFPTGSFPARFPELGKELRIVTGARSAGRSDALYDVRLGADIHVVVGSGLGGGSLVNGGVALRPDPRVFQDAVWPDPIRSDGLLEQGFERADLWLRPARYKDARKLTKYQRFKDAADKIGHRIEDTPLAVSFDDTVNLAGIGQPACTLCGDCCTGCNVGAKNTVAMTYLPDAAYRGADIFVSIEVRHITKEKDGTWRVHVSALQAGDSEQRADVLSADVVILAAGTLGSTEILLRSQANGLTVSDQLGRRFSANGDIIAFGYGATKPVNAIGIGHPAKVDDRTIGAVVSGHIEISDPVALEQSLCIEEGVIPSALAPMLPVLFLPNGRLAGALKSLIAGVYDGPFKHLQTFFSVSHDSASGRLSLSDNCIALHWPDVEQEPVYQRLHDKLSELVTAAGGSYVKNPLVNTSAGNKPATAHPLGGCGFGEDSSTGVVNHKGQVFDTSVTQRSAKVHAGLYVIDGSVVPRSLGVNPLLTITALSERAMLHFARDHNLGALGLQKS